MSAMAAVSAAHSCRTVSSCVTAHPSLCPIACASPAACPKSVSVCSTPLRESRVTEGLAPVLMVQGTASSAGKSTLVAGLCRLFARRGLRVAPFKAQNMSNNAAVCPGGGEIGLAQFAQAVAAHVTPTVDMNPILLKPLGGASQVIVRGQVHGVQTARQYFGPQRDDLWPLVADSLDRLR